MQHGQPEQAALHSLKNWMAQMLQQLEEEALQLAHTKHNLKHVVLRPNQCHHHSTPNGLCLMQNTPVKKTAVAPTDLPPLRPRTKQTTPTPNGRGALLV
jgi:hypothetical protein